MKGSKRKGKMEKIMSAVFNEGGIARLAHKFLTIHAPTDKASALTHLRGNLGVYDAGGYTLASAVESYFSKVN